MKRQNAILHLSLSKTTLEIEVCEITFELAIRKTTVMFLGSNRNKSVSFLELVFSYNQAEAHLCTITI